MTPADVVSHPITPRQIKARRISFEYPDGTLDRHYMDGGEPVTSHVVAVLSSLFPEGEDFFVQSVRNYRDDITDPELKRQVAGFIGQEAIHGREHRTFNERLAALGYPTRLIDRLTKWGLWVGSKVLPKPVQLAITAALEHYTATLAEVLLGDPEANAKLDNAEVRSLFLWHAVEESEHKSVAFDVYETVSGKRWLRNLVMNLMTVGFLAAVVAGTVLSLALDPSSYRHPIRLGRGIAQLRHSPWLRRSVIRRLRDYNRRGFHPDDHDATALLEKWRTELFGDHGSLAPRLGDSTSGGA